MSLDHEESSSILGDFVRAMDECGSWPDEEADMIRLAEIAHRARCHMQGIPHERRCPRPLPTNSDKGVIMETRQQEQKLKAAAEVVQASFPGPWKECEGMSKGIYRGVRPSIVLDARPEVARYVAAASPDVILNLMRRQEDAERTVAEFTRRAAAK